MHAYLFLITNCIQWKTVRMICRHAGMQAGIVGCITLVCPLCIPCVLCVEGGVISRNWRPCCCKAKVRPAKWYFVCAIAIVLTLWAWSSILCILWAKHRTRHRLRFHSRIPLQVLQVRPHKRKGFSSKIAQKRQIFKCDNRKRTYF